MYCAVEMNTLKVTHVDYTIHVVMSLAHIEATKPPYDIRFENTESSAFLNKLTTSELQKLYSNLTGKELDNGCPPRVMRAAIAHVVRNLHPRGPLSNEELRSQLEYAQDNPGQVYRFVKGSTLPAVPDQDLWPVKGVHLTKAEFDAAQEAAGALTDYERPVGQEAPKRAPSRPAAAPTGGSRPVIWAHADKVWEAAGKPMDQGVVLKMRKQMMVDLEAEGIKKSTSSTALGDWMKARLTGA